MIKTDTEGDTLFTKAYGGSSIEIGENIAETEKGYYLLGETRSFSEGGLDMCVIQTDTLGKSTCRFMNVHPSISDPVWVEHSGSTMSDGCQEEMTELQLSDVSIKTNDICVCKPPVAKFETTILDGLIFFNDLSTWPDSWLWDFGDGETSVEQNPEHFMPEAKNVCLTVQNQCGSDTTCETVFGGGGGLKNDIQNLIKLFPNPAGDYFSVTCEESLRIKSVTITDVVGGEVYRLSEIDKFPLTINTGRLNNGIYMVRFLTYDHILISKKIIIE